MVKPGREVMIISIKVFIIALSLVIGACANWSLVQAQTNSQKKSSAKSAITDDQKEKIIEQVGSLVEKANEDIQALRFDSAIRNYEEGLRLSKQIDNRD